MLELLTLSPPPNSKKKILLEAYEYKKDMTSGVMYTAETFLHFPTKISTAPRKKGQFKKKTSGFSIQHVRAQGKKTGQALQHL